MTTYTELIKSPEYDFLLTNPNLGKNICLLTLGGSRAYGTNLPDSDVDIRGVATNPSSQLFGLTPDFEQVVEMDTDTTVYSISKIVKLLMSCNPNTIEMLGCRPQDYIYKNDFGRRLLDNKDAFLSKRAIESFGGYAGQQFNRLEHGLLGNGDNDDKKLKMLKDSLERDIESFSVRHSNDTFFAHINEVSTETLQTLYPGKKIEDDVSNEHLLVSGSFSDIPITDFKTIIGEIHKIQSEYGNINKRNTKKTDEKLAKHMMHLIRLYMMGTDLNTGKGIITYRSGHDHEVLMSIRNGDYMTGDGMKVIPEFYELLHEYQSKYAYATKNTVLSDEPDTNTLTDMMRDIYADILTKERDLREAEAPDEEKI